MKKMILGAAALAMTFGVGSPAFAADDPWSGFWGGIANNPTANANYSWVSGGIAAGASVQDAACPDGCVDGDIEGKFEVKATTNTIDCCDYNTEAWSKGKIYDYSGIAADDEGQGGSAFASIGSSSGAWENGSTAVAVNSNQAIISVGGDAAVKANVSGGAAANFINSTGLYSEISVGGPMPPF